ncbi:hypothetical protein D3C78_1116930 [compost metagenome]
MMLVRQQTAQHILRPVRILIFIDMNVLEFFLIEIKHFRNLLEQFNRLHDQIVKIERIVAAKASLIHRIHLGNDSFKIITDLLLILLWRDQFVFGGADHRLNCLRLEFFRVDVQLLHTIPNDGELICRIQY